MDFWPPGPALCIRRFDRSRRQAERRPSCKLAKMAPGKSVRPHAFVPGTRALRQRKAICRIRPLTSPQRSRRRAGLRCWRRQGSDGDRLNGEFLPAKRLPEDDGMFDSALQRQRTRRPQRGAKQDERRRGPQRLPVVNAFIEKEEKRSRHEQAGEHRLGGDADVRLSTAEQRHRPDRHSRHGHAGKREIARTRIEHEAERDFHRDQRGDQEHEAQHQRRQRCAASPRAGRPIPGRSAAAARPSTRWHTAAAA